MGRESFRARLGDGSDVDILTFISHPSPLLSPSLSTLDHFLHDFRSSIFDSFPLCLSSILPFPTPRLPFHLRPDGIGILILQEPGRGRPSYLRLLYRRSSTLDSQSPILDPRPSILNPRPSPLPLSRSLILSFSPSPPLFFRFPNRWRPCHLLR